MSSGSEAVAHAAGKAAEAMPEIPNLLTLVIHASEGTHLAHFLHRWENVLFSFFFIAVISIFFYKGSRKSEMVPGFFQNLVETIVEALDNMVVGIMGRHGREFTPFVGTLFVYILIMNQSGLVPFLKAPTSSINTTLSLSISVFLFVQFNAFKKLGAYGTLHHLMGSPNDKIGWMFVPLMLPLHVMGELIKPISLALRLYGNIMGEDALLASFLGVGMLLASLVHLPIGVPLQFPIMMLAIITGTVQALVFSLLTTIYLFMVMPHEDGAH